MTYWEKLKDPRWQRKRLEIMQRDDFACSICYTDSETLNVHHQWYERGLDPWEYDDCALVTLCAECHKREHDSEIAFKQMMATTFEGSMHLVYLIFKRLYDHGEFRDPCSVLGPSMLEEVARHPDLFRIAYERMRERNAWKSFWCYDI